MKGIIFVAIIVIIAVLGQFYAQALKQNAFKTLLQTKLNEVYEWAKNELKADNLPYAPTPDYPYWNFMPMLKANARIGDKGVEWSSKCFSNNRASADYNSDKTTLEVTITSYGPIVAEGSEVCEESYMAIVNAAMVPGTSVRAFASKPITTTSISIPLPSDLSDAEKWDIDNYGVRLLRYPKPRGESLSNLIKTIEGFIPEFLPSVPKPIAELNRDFITKYTGFPISERDPSLNRIPDESEVKSGDALYVMRLDGLNSMLAWAMGSTTGHVTTAMWIDGELYVCESTVDGAYWPTDYIQKTPYRTWVQQATDAGYQVVWAPLNDQARKSYNETAAVAFFKANEGFNYGFKTMIWPWLDTLSGNFPCLPSDYESNCMTWDLLQPLIAFVDRVVPEIGDTMWNDGFAKRINVESTRTTALYQAAMQKGMAPNYVITIPEQDTWMYNTTRYDEPAVGRAMVCCVFVCSTWKAAGVFGEITDSVNCGEFTNWDDYSLTIHAEKYEQIIGTYSLDLNAYNSKDMFAHIAEKCPALPPGYVRPEGC